MKINLKELVREYRYRAHPHWPFLSFSIFQSGNQWVVAENGGGIMFPFKVMNGKMFGGGFDTLRAAEAELRRVIKHYYAPLKNSELMRYFTEDWIEGEEQSKELRAFRLALYQAQYKEAARIYNQKLSNYTKEAIPSEVTFQIWLNLPTGKLKEAIS
jgi:hypothetical protein